MTFKLQHISYFRSELMGFAILWIMAFHFDFMQIPILPNITQYGYAGVEIFMFVSGFGIFYSLSEKGNNLFNFYKKRIMRIFPAYYLIGILDSIFVFHDNLFTYLFRFSTIGYWFGTTFDEWYIPSLRESPLPWLTGLSTISAEWWRKWIRRRKSWRLRWKSSAEKPRWNWTSLR